MIKEIAKFLEMFAKGVVVFILTILSLIFNTLRIMFNFAIPILKKVITWVLIAVILFVLFNTFIL